jgi:hypothetical protein
MQPPSVAGKLYLIHLQSYGRNAEARVYPWRRSYSAAETLMPLHPNRFLIVIPPSSVNHSLAASCKPSVVQLFTIPSYGIRVIVKGIA